MPTISSLVDSICASLVERGCDVSPSDVAFAISVFLESAVLLDDPHPAALRFNAGMQDIIDAVNSVRDE